MRDALNNTGFGTDRATPEIGFAATCGREAERGRSASPRASSFGCAAQLQGWAAHCVTAPRHGLADDPARR